MNDIIEQLNSSTVEERLAAVKEVSRLIENGVLTTTPTEEVNNHVHTIYSFSPYSPSMAAYMAWKAGLKAVGIMDHDSVAGAKEMITACALIGIASTVGFELRVNFSGTAVEGRKINSPDSENIAYLAIHGIPFGKLEDAENFLKPVQEVRNMRNRRMVNKLNDLIVESSLPPLDFTKDVYEISQAAHGGSITERHLLYALSNKIIRKCGKGEALTRFLKQTLELMIPEKIEQRLLDENNPHYIYDLLGILKSSFLEKIFIQPDSEECISVYEVVKFANNIHAIPCYAYLGDIKESPTGDKKAEKFEDDYLDELIAELKNIGFKAVTYMPPRNTIEQLRRIRQLCAENHLMEISGVDINSSRQSFNCPEVMAEEFSHLLEATWALIAHEKLTDSNEKYSLFHDKNLLREKSLNERIRLYSKIGRQIDRRHPENAKELVTF
jgi:hypothetical protein